MSNCLLFAFWRWVTYGGYVIVRKSHYGWWPHFLWSPDLRTFEEYTPAVPNHHLPIPPPLYRGVIKESRTTMPDLIADACARAARFEEEIPYLYLDSARPPNVTAGAGHVLRSAEEASELFGCDMSSQFAKVQSCAGGHLAQYYAQFTTARLTPAQIASRLTTDMAAKLTELVSKMSGWHGLPYNLQLACLDMAFNLGVWGFMMGFPAFMDLLKARPLDLRRLAVESKRNQKDLATGQIRELDPPRNAEIAALILSAWQPVAA